MDDLKKENQMEENLKNEDGGTPTPSQQENDDSIDNNSQNDEENSQDENFSDNSDLSLEDVEKELENLDDNEEVPSQDENVDVDENSNPIDENQKGQEKLLTQSQVNELVGKARKEGRESALKDLMSRYGVYDENELNDIFGRGQAYDDLDYDYQNQGKSYKDAMAENALLKSHIVESRWKDVKSILAGEGLDITPENIAALLPTHQEWIGNNNSNMVSAPQERPILTEEMAQGMVDNQYQTASNQIGTKKPGVLKKLGNEPTPPTREKTEEELAAELYGVKSW